MIEVCKILFDLCFYYSLSGYYLYLLTDNYPSVWGVPVLMLSAVLHMALAGRRSGVESADSGRYVIARRVVCCALPGLLLAFRPTIPQLLQYLPAWAYLGFMLWSGLVYTDRREFAGRFSFTAKLFALAAFGIIGLSRVGGALAGAIPYLIIYLLTGVCLMRVLREEGSLTGGRNVAVLLTVLLGSGAFAVLNAPKLILAAAEFIYLNVIVKIIMGIAYVLAYLVGGFLRILDIEAQEVKLDLNLSAEELYGEEIRYEERGGFPVWLKPVATVILILIVALVVFLIFRRLLGRKASDRRDQLFSEERERLDKRDARGRPGLLRPREPRLIVRWYYRKYLKDGSLKGLGRVPADTSLTIWKKSRQLFPEEDAWQLRELYVTARYNERAEIKKTDADAAGEIWRRMKHS